MSHRKVMFPINLYILAVLFGLILWFFAPTWSHFIGACSLTDALVCSLSVQKRLVAVLVLCWIPLWGCALVTSYVFARRHQITFPFLLTVGSDLVLSLLFIVYKIYISNYTELFTMILGLIIRILCFICLIVFLRKHKLS